MFPHALLTASVTSIAYQTIAVNGNRRLMRGSLGDRQELIYLPFGRLGFIVMSYLGNIVERSRRAL